MRHNSLFNAIALEDAVAEIAPPVAKAEPLALPDFAELDKHEDAIATQDQSNGEALGVFDALESLRDSVGVMATEGDINETNAGLLKVSLGYLNKQAGTRASVVPAMESIVDNAKKIIAAIIAALKRAVVWVKQQFAKLFDAAELINKAIPAVMARAVVMQESKKQKEGFCTDKGLLAHLTIDGKFPANLSKEVGALNNMSGEVLRGIQVSAYSAGKIVLHVLDNRDYKNLGRAVSILSKKINGFKEVDDTAVAKDTHKVPFAIQAHYASPDLLGDQYVLHSFPEYTDGEHSAYDLEPCKFSLMKREVSGFEENFKARWATPNEVLDMLTDIESIVANVLHYRERLPQVVDLQEKCIKAMEALEKGEFPGNAEEMGYRRKLINAVRVLPPTLTGLTANFSSYSLKTSKALMQYCNQSVTA